MNLNTCGTGKCEKLMGWQTFGVPAGGGFAAERRAARRYTASQ